MIKDTDILKNVSKILDTKFGYEIYTQNNDEKVKEPSFFISINHLSSNSFKYWNEKSINIYITYTNLGVLQEELLDMENELDELFDMYIDVNNYKLMFKNKKFNIKDDFMTMKLSVDFLDNKTTVPSEDTASKLMENLNLETK